MIRTLSNQSWELGSKFASLGEEILYIAPMSDPRVVLIEPALPHIYIPSLDF